GGEGAAPLYPGARACIERLRRDETLLLSVATGKARRGLDHTLGAHGLEGVFIATQTCSENPGKPHPGMIESCLAATGVAAADAVMIGDTVFDMEMAANAGVAAIGVAWGYHAAEELADAGAREIVSDFDALGRALEALWR
ncbi:MAG: HAD-IA family hydrolase, partial [Pseudomonadota bacterium]